MTTETTDLITVTLLFGTGDERVKTATRADWLEVLEKMGTEHGWTKTQLGQMRREIRAALERPCTCTLGDGPAGVCGICGGVRA